MIIHVNNIDLSGRRFNGYDMQLELNRRGITSKMVVMDKLSEDSNVIPLTKEGEAPYLWGYCNDLEMNLSIQSMVYPYGWRLLNSPEFKCADAVHYHLIHNKFISLAMLPDLVAAKPSVLSLHDPWFFTGHCVHPYDCERWQTGCGGCPDLSSTFGMTEDNTRLMWNIKKEIFEGLNISLVTASKFMLDMARKSPITRDADIHQIPFGVDNEFFAEDDGKARQRLGIPEDSFVMFFRATESEFKGLDFIKKMLKALKPPKQMTILTCDEKGLLSGFRGKYKLVEKGKVYDKSGIADLYRACDVFLMPSTAEAFGLMAVEAMASARPVIVTDGTSLPDVTFAPECGISIPQNDEDAFKDAVQRLVSNPAERRFRGARGRELALKHYRFEDYVNRHIKLYEDIGKGG